MSLRKLHKRLRREATANPKKAAILGLLLVVALYFWAPLLTGLFAKEDLAAEPLEEVPVAGLGPFGPVTASPVVADQPAEEEPRTYAWEQLVKWLEEDPATTPAADLPQRRDPFRAVRPEIAETQIEEDDDEEPGFDKLTVTPESLGLELSGTVVGLRRRVALIAGKAYAEGRTVELPNNGEPIEFRLTEVHAQRVVLTRLGEQYELAIPRPARSGMIEPFGSGN